MCKSLDFDKANVCCCRNGELKHGTQMQYFCNIFHPMLYISESPSFDRFVGVFWDQNSYLFPMLQLWLNAQVFHSVLWYPVTMLEEGFPSFFLTLDPKLQYLRFKNYILVYSLLPFPYPSHLPSLQTIPLRPLIPLILDPCTTIWTLYPTLVIIHPCFMLW